MTKTIYLVGLVAVFLFFVDTDADKAAGMPSSLIQNEVEEVLGKEPDPVKIEDWSRQAVKIPDSLWQEACKSIGFTGDIGISPEEQFLFDKPDNVLKAVEEAMRDVRNVSRATGRISGRMTMEPQLIRERVYFAYAQLDSPSARGFKPPNGSSWGVDYITDGATSDAAFEELLKRWNQAGIDVNPASDLERFTELAPAVKRLVARLAIAFEEGSKWLKEALGHKLLDEIANNQKAELFETVRPLSAYVKSRRSPTRRSYEIVEQLDLKLLSYASNIFFSYVDAALAEWHADESNQKGTLQLEVCAFNSPFGRIEIAGGVVDRTTEGAAISIDLQGDTKWIDAGIEKDSQTLSLLIDFSGDDTYQSNGDCTLGTGCFGIGALYDYSGSDVYRMGDIACGTGFCGTGVLADFDGDDKYEGASTEHSQGAGSFGLGILLDARGDDSFTCCTMSQGFGGPSGGGYIIDLAGNDSYVATDQNYSDLYKAAVNFSQGAAWGRRPDFSNGHQFAGGIGGMVDAAGDDLYQGYIWSQAVAYWWGLGFIEDLGGDDTYATLGEKYTYYAQGNAVHYGVASHFDLSGNDKHIRPEGRRGPICGYAADRSVTSFIDAAGNDLYDIADPDKNERGGLAFCQQTGACLFWDRVGTDHYRITEGLISCAGSARRAGKRAHSSRDDLYSRSLFLDTGGEDTYEFVVEENKANDDNNGSGGDDDSDAKAEDRPSNNAIWRRIAPGSVPNGEGGGVDRAHFVK